MKNRVFLSLFTVALGVLLSASAQAVTLVYDFGHRPGDSVDAGVNLVIPNDALLTNPEESQNVADSIDTGGASTGISLTIQNGLYFNVFNGSNGSGTTAPIGDAAAFFSRAPEENLTSDALYGHTGAFANETRPSVEYLIEGLESDGLYDFVFFADRGNGSGDRSAEYTVGGSSAALDVFENTDDVAQILGVQANGSGELTLTIAPSATNNHSLGFFYLGAMQISSSIPEPTSLCLLGFGVLGLMGVSRRRS